MSERPVNDMPQLPEVAPCTAVPAALPAWPSHVRPLEFVPEEDPIFPLPPVAEMERALREAPEEFCAFLRERQAAIVRRRTDPFRHGHTPAIWALVDDLLVRGRRVVMIDPASGAPRELTGGSEVFLTGGNRAGKTEYAAKKVVRVLVEKDAARAWCFHTTGPSSIAMQQPRIWAYLPNEWRNLGRSKIADIKYSQKNGFAGVTPTFVGPNGSQCWFKNYAQSVDTIEGEELDVAWLDELAPPDVIETIRLRLVTRRGLLIITFTPIHGYTATVKSLLDGATTLVEAPAPLLPILDAQKQPTGRHESVPRVQQGAAADLKIVYFHTSDNPFGGYRELVKKCEGRDKDYIKCRAYGVPTKTVGAQFPTFSDKLHVISPAKFAELCKTGTRKMYCDPCSGRNWYMLWAMALPDERSIVVYREWPSPGHYIEGVGDPGMWAVPDGKKHDGKRGDAQKPWGFGLKRYVEEILRAEGWTHAQTAAALARNDLTPGRGEGWQGVEEIWARVMDSRFGAAPTLAHSESITLIESLSNLGMHFEPAPGEHQQEGIDQINELLYYDRERYLREGELAPDNQPRLYVVSTCRNLIYSLMEWTGMDGQHGACKDPIDVLRYMALDPPMYLNEELLSCRGGGAY